MDHIGRLPKLVRDGFAGIIYSTKETKETTTLGWAWVLIALVACGLVITFIVQVM
jgi:predicted metal-dependent RNase